MIRCYKIVKTLCWAVLVVIFWHKSWNLLEPFDIYGHISSLGISTEHTEHIEHGEPSPWQIISMVSMRQHWLLLIYLPIFSLLSKRKSLRYSVQSLSGLQRDEGKRLPPRNNQELMMMKERWGVREDDSGCWTDLKWLFLPPLHLKLITF